MCNYTKNSSSKKGLKWDKRHHTSVHYVKNNTVTSTAQHFNSFGNKENFGMIGNLSVGQYLNKHKHVKGHMNSSIIDTMASNEIEISIDNIARIISAIRVLIAPLFDVAYEMQGEKGDANLKN